MLENISISQIYKNLFKFNRNIMTTHPDFYNVYQFQFFSFKQFISFLTFQISQIFIKNMEPQSVFPTYELVETAPEDIKTHLNILTKSESQSVPQAHREQFNKDGSVVVQQGGKQSHFISTCKTSKCSITKNSYITFSKGVTQSNDYYGIASDLLACHKFCRKQKKPAPLKIYVQKNTKDADKIISLSSAKNQCKEHANGRGDQQGVPQFFQKLAQKFASQNGLQITVIKGDDLVKQGFRLMHAVGRASKNAPTFINLKYNGNPDSNQWVAFVGKGVCFDSGGLNIKPTSGIKDMHLDKSGAVGVFTAFQYVVKQKIKINLTVSMGFVENFVSSISYRPSDIFKSRKGLMVQIGNTDAEGRLVLADCMNWTQEKYKTIVLIQLSTLTGAIITALGHSLSGLFTNSQQLSKDLISAGKQVHQQSWVMPITDYHRQLIKHKYADITNSAGKTEGSACQAAAFLQNFVEKDVKWIHLDVAGTAMVASQGTGYGARLLLQYARNYASK